MGGWGGWFFQGYRIIEMGDEMGRSTGVVEAINNFLVFGVGKNLWIR